MASNFSFNQKEDPYSILGVDKHATQEEIKKAYHEKAFIYHPDKNINNTDELKVVRAMQMKQLTSAYSLIVNDRSRADELSEQSRDQDSYNDGIRVINGYLTQEKRLSDKFRAEFNTNDDSTNSFQYSLGDDL